MIGGTKPVNIGAACHITKSVWAETKMKKQKCDSYLESAIFCDHSICPELHVTCSMDDATFVFVGHQADLLRRVCSNRAFAFSWLAWLCGDIKSWKTDDKQMHEQTQVGIYTDEWCWVQYRHKWLCLWVCREVMEPIGRWDQWNIHDNGYNGPPYLDNTRHML